jgi:hypothetical protein
MGYKSGAYKVSIRKHEGGIDMDGRNLMEDLGINWRMILKLILKKQDWGGGFTGLVWLRIRTSGRML